jgi:hypothetical protein
MLVVADGLLVDIRNVGNGVARFNANLEPILAFGIVPIAGARAWYGLTFKVCQRARKLT